MSPLVFVSLEVLPEYECERLMRTQNVGRLGVVVGDQPLILPVNYAMQGRDVVFRTDRGTHVSQAAGHRVAFEIDGTDAAYREGWSVLVVGRAYEERDPGRIRELDHLPLRPWAPGGKDQWIRITPGDITGRRLVHHDALHSE